MVKKSATFLSFLILMLIGFNSSAQNTRGFYLTGIGSWLGNTSDENDILSYAQGNGYNYILFYDLPDINWSSSTDLNNLASFINRAHQHGITEIGAVVEDYSFVTSCILSYNLSRANANERFNVINLEFEFWAMASINALYTNQYLIPNGYSCDTAGAFRFAWKQFKLIDSLCAARGYISEVYLGWPNKGQMQQLASRADRILLHAYRPTDGDVYAYSRNRLMDIASISTVKKVIPLFSSEPAFMGPWLSTHPMTRPYQTYKSDYNAETGSFKQFIDLQGFQWFTYEFMPHTIMATASITANGPLSFCPGGSVVLTANSGSSYYWTPGGQTTQSITVTSPGSYTVRVANASGVSVVSTPVVVTNATSGTIPTINSSGPLSFCPGGSVTLTSSPSVSYLWSNGATSQSITVSNSGTYTVTTGSGACSATSPAIAVSATATPHVPIITTSGSLNICPGSTVTLTSSAANSYLWSNGATTRSIVVGSAGNYFVNAYAGPGCSAQSTLKTVNLLSAPPVPSISSSGGLTLSASHPVVSLSTSTASSYLWSNGATTRTINVSNAGSYMVTISGTNGCKSTSPAVSVKGSFCQAPAVPVIGLSGSTVLHTGQTVTLTSSQGGGYLWSTGETTQSIVVSGAGTFTVRVYSGSNCYSTSLPVTITTTSPREAAGFTKSDFGMKAFPNPVRSILNLQYSSENEGEFTFRMTDITGREVMRNVLKSIPGINRNDIDCSQLPGGIYFICLSNAIDAVTTRIVIE